MGRENRAGGFRTLFQNHFFFLGKGKSRRGNARARRFISPAKHFQGLEALESRVLLSSTPTLIDGVLTCTGYAGQTNTITVAVSSDGASIDASVDGASATFATASVKSLVVNAGTRTDSIAIDLNIQCDE